MFFSGPGEIFHFTTRGFEDAATNETVVSAEGSTFFKRTKSNPFDTSSGRSRCLVVVSLPISFVRTVILHVSASIQLSLCCLNAGCPYRKPHPARDHLLRVPGRGNIEGAKRG